MDNRCIICLCGQCIRDCPASCKLSDDCKVPVMYCSNFKPLQIIETK